MLLEATVHVCIVFSSVFLSFLASYYYVHVYIHCTHVYMYSYTSLLTTYYVHIKEMVCRYMYSVVYRLKQCIYPLIMPRGVAAGGIR